MKPTTEGLKLCTPDEWANYLVNCGVRHYQTESNFNGGYSVMYSRDSSNRHNVLAEVHYLPNATREYFIKQQSNPKE